MGVKIWVQGNMGICGQYTPDPPSGISMYKDETGNLVVEVAAQMVSKKCKCWWCKLYQWLKLKLNRKTN